MVSPSKIYSILLKKNLCVPFHKSRFVGSTNMLGHSVWVSVLKYDTSVYGTVDDTVRIIFKGKNISLKKYFEII